MDECTLVGSKCAETFSDENVEKSETGEEGDENLDSLPPQKETSLFESNKTVSLPALCDVIAGDDRVSLMGRVPEVDENPQSSQTSADIVSSETNISESHGCDMKESDISEVGQICSKEMIHKFLNCYI